MQQFGCMAETQTGRRLMRACMWETWSLSGRVPDTGFSNIEMLRRGALAAKEMLKRTFFYLHIPQVSPRCDPANKIRQFQRSWTLYLRHRSCRSREGMRYSETLCFRWDVFTASGELAHKIIFFMWTHPNNFRWIRRVGCRIWRRFRFQFQFGFVFGSVSFSVRFRL